jgi:hypothetical protein
MMTMKISSILILLGVCAYTSLTEQAQTCLPTKKSGPTELSLRQFRQMLLNQRIVILKGIDVRGSLGGWQPIKLSPEGSFKDDFDKGAFIAYRYKDQIPKVVDIRESAGSELAKEGHKNALGEIVTDEDIVDPHVNIIVQFDDGQLAKYSSFVSLIMDRQSDDPDHWEMEFMLASVRDLHAEKVRSSLQSSIGQKVYAVHESLVFGTDLGAEDLLDASMRTSSPWWNSNFDLA